MKRNPVLTLLCGCCAVLLGSLAEAGVWYDGSPAVKPGIPDIGWVSSDTELTQPTDQLYCGYVAAANVLSYWDSHGLPNLVADGTTPDQLMTDLKPYMGTYPRLTCSELETGLEKYFAAKGYSNMVINQHFYPGIKMDLIQEELKKCEQVIVGLFEAEHWVTATGWYDVAGDTWLGVHDPQPLQSGGANLGGAEDYYHTRQGTKNLEVYYGGQWVRAHNVITVSIPEPSTLVVWSVFAAIGITVGCRRPRRKAGRLGRR